MSFATIPATVCRSGSTDDCILAIAIPKVPERSLPLTVSSELLMVIPKAFPFATKEEATKPADTMFIPVVLLLLMVSLQLFSVQFSSSSGIIARQAKSPLASSAIANERFAPSRTTLRILPSLNKANFSHFSASDALYVSPLMVCPAPSNTKSLPDDFPGCLITSP